MDAKELKWLLRRQTRCSKWRMIVQDKNYDAVHDTVMQQCIESYDSLEGFVWDEEWDCDDIARDFWNFAKKKIKRETNKNAPVGLLIFPDHTEIIYGKLKYETGDLVDFYYLDQRDWYTCKPNKKPKWILM